MSLRDHLEHPFPRAALGLALLLASSSLVACGDSDTPGDDDSDSDTTDATATGTETSGGTGGDGDPGDGDGDPGDGDGDPGDGDGDPGDGDGDPGDGDGDPSCSVATQNLLEPANIVISIDNSGSMTQEIQALQDSLYPDFAAALDQAPLDYRIVLVTEHGPINLQSVCIEEPLSLIPQGGCAMPPPQPGNDLPHFGHFSMWISSHDLVCKIVDRYDTADLLGLAPNGYQDWLDPDAFTHFVALTDDGVMCMTPGLSANDLDDVNAGETAGAAVDAAILALSPSFGTAEDRRYRWHNLIGLDYADPNDHAVGHGPADPIIAAICPQGVDPGTGYQALARTTGGASYSLCDTGAYPSIFAQLAQAVLDQAQRACSFALPEEVVDPQTASLSYTPGDGGDPIALAQVADLDACVWDEFYIDEEGVHLCPGPCAAIESDESPLIEVIYPCG